MPRNTPAESVQTFMQRAAEQFALIATAKTVKDGGLATNLAGAGIKGEISATGTGPVSVTVTVDENHGLPAGLKRSELKEDALAVYDAKALRTAKERVYQQIRHLTRGEQINGDKAIALLTALGYSAESQPTARTSATITIPARRKDGHDTRDVVLDGNMSEEELVAAVTDALVREGDDGHLRADQIMSRAFGDKLSNAAVLVTVSNYRVATVWPERSEFAV